MASAICLQRGSFIETLSLKISCLEEGILWKLLFVTLGLLHTLIKKSIFLSGVALPVLWLQKLSTSGTCLLRVKLSVMYFRSESSSITCFWTNLSLREQDTVIFWPKIELVTLTLTRKSTPNSILMLSISLNEWSRKGQSSESPLIKPSNIHLFAKLKPKKWKLKKISNSSPQTCLKKDKLRQLTLHQHLRVTVFRWIYVKRTQARHWTETWQNSTVFIQKVVTKKTWQE